MSETSAIGQSDRDVILDSCKKVLCDNAEMTDFLQNFPIDDTQDVGQSQKRKCDEPVMLPGKDWKNFFDNFETESLDGGVQVPSINQKLEDLEKSLTCIRCVLEGKRKKITLADIDKKLDSILEVISAKQ